MPVVTALEFDDRWPPGKTARQANRSHCRLSAGTDQSDLLHGGQATRNAFRHVYFTFGRCSEAQSARCGFLHRIHYLRMSMAEDQRPPRPNIVNVTLALGIPDI